MNLFDHTYPTPAENLACEEALLEEYDSNVAAGGVLRFWESPDYFVVVGYSNKIATEVDEAACRAAGVPVYRRCSGGGTVLQGPGCLNYAVVIPAPSESVTETNRLIMERNRAAIASLWERPSGRDREEGRDRKGAPTITVEGVTDLCCDGRKFSGNAQRRKRQYVLFHGTFLLNFDLARIEQYLRLPSKQPAYRQSRAHTDFLCNLAVPAAQVRQALIAAWDAREPLGTAPTGDIAKYNSAEWIRKF